MSMVSTLDVVCEGEFEIMSVCQSVSASFDKSIKHRTWDSSQLILKRDPSSMSAVSCPMYDV